MSRATFLGLFPPCAPGSMFNLCLGNSDMVGGARNISSTQECEQRMAKKDVPEIPFNRVLLRQIYLQI